jgi:hypothetical protein
MTHPPDYEPDDTESQRIAEVFAAAALEGPLFEPSASERPWAPPGSVPDGTQITYGPGGTLFIDPDCLIEEATNADADA